MSEPLRKVGPDELKDAMDHGLMESDEMHQLAVANGQFQKHLMRALNAAIDRINELETRERNAWQWLEQLEAKYGNHYHRDTTRIGDDGLRFEDHEIRYQAPTGEQNSDEHCDSCGGDHETGLCSW
jgi:hypothetical protein